MQFTEFRLINIGPYAGEHIIDVRPSSSNGVTDRPIILIGGKNGAGKTTILEAVRLCLYGATSLGARAKRADYEAYLLSRIHRPPGAPLFHSFAGVGVGFTHTIGSTTHEFVIRRMWERQRDRVRETVHVTKDGIPLSEQEMSWWEQFLADLLPPGLANLFFFDGEKIQTLADSNHDTALREAIRSLLGLDLIDRLRADISTYLVRQRRAGHPGLDTLLADLRARRMALEEEFQRAHTELGRINSLIAQCHGKLEEAERRLAREGGMLATQRERLTQRAHDLRETIRRYERQITEHANSLLPFALVPRLAQALKHQLERDAHVEQYQRVSTATDSFIATLNRYLHEEQWLAGLTLMPDQHQQIIERLDHIVRVIRAQLVPTVDPALATDAVMHPLTTEQRQQLLQWLDHAISTTPAQLAELGQDYEAAASELATIEATLLSLPAEEDVQPVLQQILHWQRELAALEARRHEQETLVQQLRRRRAALDTEEKELYTRLMRGDDPQHRINLASRAHRVLLRYEEALRRAKIKEIEEAMASCLAFLSHKGAYFRRISIDPDTFAATLYTMKGDALLREQLSAGEKQLYAVALLWALRLVSRRSLPIIVDTPLGRLDHEHRRRLVQHYFPHASHQVIILSTDTEINSELYAELEPLIARSYRLEFQRNDGATQVHSGYFQSLPEQGALREEATASYEHHSSPILRRS